MPKYRFSLNRIFPYKDRIEDFVLIKYESEKTALAYFTQRNPSENIFENLQKNIPVRQRFIVKLHATVYVTAKYWTLIFYGIFLLS